MSEPQSDLSLPRLILCEGPDDVVFLRQLIECRELPRFHIRHTGITRAERGGNSKFGSKLAALSVLRSFRAIRDVVIVSDSDSDSDRSFSNICRQIEAAGFSPPAYPTDRSQDYPSISIYMLPHRGSGNLETFCEEAARSVSRVNVAVDNFVSMARADDWPDESRGKLWLRSTIAAQWPRDPFIHLGQLFGHPDAKALIPLSHQSFNGLVSHLARIVED